MPPAQRWADNRCCGGTPLPPHRVSVPNKGGSYWYNNLVTLIMPSEIVGFCGSLVYMTIYLLEIKTSSVVFSVLNCFFYAFVFYVRSVGYIASYELIFQTWQNWKTLNIRSCFNLILVGLLLNYMWVLFIHLKLELLTQFPASNKWKIELFMKNEHLPNLINGLTKHLTKNYLI